jgi:hypothetical protein
LRIIDYNGLGQWSREAIAEHYARYCRQMNRPAPSLASTEFAPANQDRVWVYPVMNKVIERIEKSDPAAVAIGVEFVEGDQSFAFGKILKSNTARALRRATLDEAQQERLRHRFFEMLRRGYLPREYKEYAKLFKKIGLGAHRDEIVALSASDNSFVRHWRWYLLEHHGEPRSRRYLRPW